jgi:tRNA A37 threonylcarbamoyladenosine synthetase subunit TsaC/SUA5/YrdC
VAMSAAAVDIIHNNIQNVGQTNTQTIQTIVKRKDNKFKNNLFVHCTHEARLQGLAREIHTIHNSFFKNTHRGDIRLIVGHRNNPNIEYELARKRPSSSLLKDPSKPKSKRCDDESLLNFKLFLIFY